MADRTLHPLMHSISLEFMIKDLEHTFLKAFTTGRYILDNRSSVFGFVTHIVFSILGVGLGKDLALSVFTLERLAVCVGLWYFGKRYIPWGRTSTIITHLIVADFIIAPNLIRWMGDAIPVTFLSIAKHMFISSGVFTLWYLAAEFVLPFKYIALTHAVSAVILSYFMTADCCTMLLGSELGSSTISYSWNSLHKLLSWASYAGRMQILDLEALNQIGSQPQLSCMCLVILAQVAAGYLLPMLALYIMERRERVHFWAATFGHREEEVAVVSQISVASKVVVAVALGVGCLCAWEAVVVLAFNDKLP